MKKAIFVSLFFACINGFCSLDVGFCVNYDCGGEMPDAHFRGSCENINPIGFCISDNDFPDASTANPIYLRFRLTHNARLCETLVGPNERFPWNQPIHLTMQLTNNAPLTTINVPGNGCSIVRWIAGEPEFWLKITAESSTWINVDGDLQAPTVHQPVQVNIGRFSNNYQIDFDMGTANRPFDSRDDNLPLQINGINTDLRTSTIEPSPSQNSILSVNISAYDASTEGVETVTSYEAITLGLDPGVLIRTFCLDLARAWDFYPVPALNNIGLTCLFFFMCFFSLYFKRKMNGNQLN